MDAETGARSGPRSARWHAEGLGKGTTTHRTIVSRFDGQELLRVTVKLILGNGDETSRLNRSTPVIFAECEACAGWSPFGGNYRGI